MDYREFEQHVADYVEGSLDPALKRRMDAARASSPELDQLARVHEQPALDITAAEIFSRVLAKEDEIATMATQLFFEALGQVAGNLALTLGAYDGVFLAGGILKRYPDLLKASDFRAGFEAKGRHRKLLESVPTSLILHPQPGLLGASHCARELLGQRG